jgi:hypothetical protein
LRAHDRPDLLPDRLAERVGLRHREASHVDGDLERLLLVEDDPERLLKDRLQIGMEVLHGSLAVLSRGVLQVHSLAERARPVERDERHDVLEPVGAKLLA